jgi:hypothetical protein
MLLTIRKSAGPGPVARDALEELLACHERIRRFTRLATQIAGAGDDDAREAAAAVHRYFTLALPLHAADEDLSLAPRLLAAPCDPQVRAELDHVTREHVEIECLLAELAPIWSAVVRDPSLRQVRAETLDRGAARLLASFEVHLEREERVVFPAARRCLAPADLSELRSEMRARRKT